MGVGAGTSTSFAFRNGFLMYRVLDRNVSANTTASFFPASSKLCGVDLHSYESACRGSDMCVGQTHRAKNKNVSMMSSSMYSGSTLNAIGTSSGSGSLSHTITANAQAA